MFSLKKINLLFLGSALICATSLNAVTKTSDEVFKKWLEWQRIYSDQGAESMKKNMTDQFVSTFKKQYEKNLSTLRHMHQPFLKTLTNNQINEFGYEFQPRLDETFKQNLCTMYELIDHDMIGFSNYLKSLSMTKVSDSDRSKSDNLTETYVALSSLPFAQENPEQENALLFSVANRLFRGFFSEENFPHFQKLFLDKSAYPIARFIYSTVWYNLAGTGWKNWSQECLQNLKVEADKGKQLVYIAGGSDIYQLIKHGIYNIKNIDPQLPSQPKYYTNDWGFILKGDSPNGGIGDQILFDFDGKKITMQRINYQETGTTFKARLADGQVVTLPHSTTVWGLFDHTNKQIGSYTLERRFTRQEDFVDAPDTFMLMSFNELFFISIPDFLNGWGIEPGKFPETFKLNIKQLAQPVTQKMICNIRVASLLNSSDFRFISLGTCIN